jgi:hypothetical protein
LAGEAKYVTIMSNYCAIFKNYGVQTAGTILFFASTKHPNSKTIIAKNVANLPQFFLSAE